jgi:basic amino acid/polyamine antiporter, APA family
LSGTYGQLLNYVTFASLLFYMVTIAGLFRLRITEPNTERPYRAFGYPLVPALYILCAGLFCFNLLYEPTTRGDVGKGLLIVLLGGVVYLVREQMAKKSAASA